MQNFGTPADSAGSFELLLGVEAIAILGFLGLLVRGAFAGSSAAWADALIVVLKAVLYILVAALVAGAAMLLAWVVSGATLSNWSALAALRPAYAGVFVCVYASSLALLWWAFRGDRRR